MTDQCKSCGALILWRKHRSTGSPMPLNAEPELNGGGWVLLGNDHYEGADPAFQGPTYTSHFATCPEGSQWRGRRRQRALP